MHSAVSQRCSDGEVEIYGVETDTLIAGRLEICVGGQWFAVYDEDWGPKDAGVVCKRKRFGMKLKFECSELSM